VTRLPAILAVDGGGSKIDAVLLRKDGAVLGAARVPTTDFDQNGGDVHMGQVLDAVAAASVDAGLSAARIPVAQLGVYCLAGADFPVDDRRIDRWLRTRGITDERLVRNDTFAVLRAGTDRDWGVGVVCGYGINCSGVAPDGRITRFPAVGPISGDWGGGNDIGEAGLWHAIRSEDGRGPKTELQATIPAGLGYRRPFQVLTALHTGKLDVDRIAQLPPVVFETAARGDAAARSIIDRQADEVVALATTAIRRLRMTRLDVDVVLGGGIFRNDDAVFFDRIRDGVAQVAPAATITVLSDPPVIGAAQLGLDRVGATRAAHVRARAALTHERLAAHTHRAQKE
jgi:N-acetylglucosamine kinase-like BadF-type ATPase